jgi:hypothetical protein
LNFIQVRFQFNYRRGQNTRETSIAFAVVIFRLDKEVIQIVTSDLDGKYELKDVSPGIHIVKAELTGFEPFGTPHVFVELGKETLLNITLQPASES